MLRGMRLGKVHIPNGKHLPSATASSEEEACREPFYSTTPLARTPRRYGQRVRVGKRRKFNEFDGSTCKHVPPTAKLKRGRSLDEKIWTLLKQEIERTDHSAAPSLGSCLVGPHSYCPHPIFLRTTLSTCTVRPVNMATERLRRSTRVRKQVKS